MPTSVLLLRAPSDTSAGPDKYEAALHAQGYRAVSVPVLETVHTNLEHLQDTLRAGTRESKYAGVIATSARACESWRRAVQLLSSEGANRDGGEEQADGGTWSSVPFYAVGEATSSALADIAAAFPSSPYVPRDVRGGAESGTGEKLARFIVAELAGKTAGPLLYLTGDKNRDTLPNILSEAGLTLESLQVYATKGSSRFEEDLREALDLGDTENNGELEEHCWIVYFAPSAAKHVAPILDKHFAIPRAGGPPNLALLPARVAVIGPTTASFLQSELNIDVAVVAEKPSPEALAAGISRWDGSQRFTE